MHQQNIFWLSKDNAVWKLWEFNINEVKLKMSFMKMSFLYFSLLRQPGSSVVRGDRRDQEGIQRPPEGSGVSGLQRQCAGLRRKEMKRLEKADSLCRDATRTEKQWTLWRRCSWLYWELFKLFPGNEHLVKVEACLSSTMNLSCVFQDVYGALPLPGACKYSA